MLAFTGIFRCGIPGLSMRSAMCLHTPCMSDEGTAHPPLWLTYTHEPSDPFPQLTHNRLCPCLTDNTCL